MPSSIITETERLKQYYNQLNWFARLLFPGQLKQAFAHNAPPLDIIQAAFNSTWFFQRWFYRGLRAFFESDIIQSSQTLFDPKSAPHGKNGVENDLNILRNLSDPVGVTEILLTIHQAEAFNPFRERIQYNLGRIQSHFNHQAVVQNLLLLAQIPLFNAEGAQANFDILINYHNPEALFLAFTQLNADGFLQDKTQTQKQDYFNTIITAPNPLTAAHTLVHADEIRAQAEQVEEAAQRLRGLQEQYAAKLQQDLQQEQREQQARQQQFRAQANQYRREQEAVSRNAPSRHDLLLNTTIEFVLDQNLLNSAEDFEIIQNHSNPGALQRALNQLQRHRLLNPATYQTLIRANHPEISANAQVAIAYPPVRVSSVRDNLRNIANDSESSTRALTPEEQARLADLRAHYAPRLTELNGIRTYYATERSKPAFQAVITALRAAYTADPAHIQINEKRVNLPLTWEEFVNQNYSDVVRRQALTAYYQHRTHTAFRYINGPNPWNIAPHYSFMPSADLREFEPLIAILWLAASDTSADMAPTEGYTVETRINRFIDELATLGRAHNWDRSRDKMQRIMKLNEKTSKEELVIEPVLDRNGRKVSEKYDDLLADSPSCALGLQGRLFQGVQGHPLVANITDESLLQHTYGFVREHFNTHIQALTPAGRTVLHAALEEAMYNFETISPEARAHLAALQVPESAQQRFLEEKAQWFGRVFTARPAYSETILAAFRAPSHVMRFAGDTNLLDLLNKAIADDEREVAAPTATNIATNISPDLRSNFLTSTHHSLPNSDDSDDDEYVDINDVFSFIRQALG